MISKLAVDTGFGREKGLSSVGAKIRYPAKYAPYQKPKYISDLSQTDYLNNMVMEWMDERYFVGESASIHSTPIQTVAENRMISQESKIHLMAVIANLLDERDRECDIVAGLPVDEYEKNKDAYTNIIYGKHDIKLLNLDGSLKKHVNVSVNRAKVIPQPVGAAFTCFINPDGSLKNTSLAGSLVGVVDIGFRTLDLCFLNNLAFVSKNSKSNPTLGCYALYKNLAEIIRQKGILDQTPEYYDSCFSQDHILIGGNLIPIEEYKKAAYEMTLAAILSEIQSTWPNIREMALILISGGGAYIFGDSIKRSLVATYKIREEVFVIPPESEFKNAEGYLLHANRVWRD